jgi:uncharacterized protein
VSISDRDKQIIQLQLGRPPRDSLSVAYRGKCSNPAVVKTKPRLADNTPFPTLYYLTCPKLNSELGTLESIGLMKELEDLLHQDEALKENYQQAHLSYLKERDDIEEVFEIKSISAGGMPDRVKCLHALAAHALAKGPGVNLIGDMVLKKIGDWCETGCVQIENAK